MCVKKDRKVTREYKIMRKFKIPIYPAVIRLFHQLYRNKFKMLLKYQNRQCTQYKKINSLPS